MYQNELETYVHVKPGIRIFIAALFIVAKTWKPTRCPSVSEWTDWHIQRMEYYSELKREELSSHERSGGSLNVYC